MKLGDYADGQSLEHDDLLGTFSVGGRVVPPSRIRELSEAGKITWSSDETRAWFNSTVTWGTAVVPAAEKPKASKKDTLVGCVVLLVVAAGLLGLLSTCGGGGSEKASVDAVALKAEVEAAQTIAPEAIAETRVDSSGGVILTLAYTKSALGGDGGINKARDIAGGLAGEILAKVPAVTSVGVFDADNSMIDIYTRK